ncbi:MAG: hypothetical protein MUF87_02235 [Anaerolineae bacterium]|jgi:hypothetical protein|nr:hypothetical protein [Anaerolineae bacterium]
MLRQSVWLTGAFSVLVVFTLTVFSQESTEFPRYCSNYEEAVEEAQLDGEQTFEEIVAEVATFSSKGQIAQIDLKQSRAGFGTYTADKSEIVTFDYWFYDMYVETRETKMRFIVLVNEQQVSAIVNSTNEYYHDILVTSNTIEKFTVQLPSLNTGLYNIAVVSITDPDSYPELGDDQLISANVFSLIVDEPNVVRRDLSFTHLEMFAQRGPNVPTLGIRNMLEEDSLQMWYPGGALEVLPDTPFDFFIKLGYIPGSPLGPQVSQFAVLLFMDYRQIPFDENTPVFYGEVDDQTAQAHIPMTLTAPSEPGKYDILSIRILNPGYVICETVEVPERSIFEMFAERVSIEVVP